MSNLNDDIKLFSDKHHGSDERIPPSTAARSSVKTNTGHFVMQEWSHEPTNLIINQPSSPARDIFTQPPMQSRTVAGWNRSREDNLNTAGPSPRGNSIDNTQKRSQKPSTLGESMPYTQKTTFRFVPQRKRRGGSRPLQTPSCDLFYNSLFI